MAATEGHESAELIASFARERRASQLQELDALDAKAGSMVGFAAIVLGLLFNSELAGAEWGWVMSGAAVCVGAALASLVIAIWPRQYSFSPTIATVSRVAFHRTANETAALMVASINHAITHNQEILDRKARLVRWGTGLLANGVLIATGRLIYALQGG